MYNTLNLPCIQYICISVVWSNIICIDSMKYVDIKMCFDSIIFVDSVISVHRVWCVYMV